MQKSKRSSERLSKQRGVADLASQMAKAARLTQAQTAKWKRHKHFKESLAMIFSIVRAFAK
jgi:hypothetical protein